MNLDEKYKALINEAKMLEKIREILGLTIEEFIYQMNWSNTKYYGYIKNGRIRNESGDGKIYSHPTIHKVFTGINYALDNHDNWKAKSSDIVAIIVTYLLPMA